MFAREADTMSPPPPDRLHARDFEAEHKALIVELADHPDPKVRILAHLSTRQFELSERLSTMQRDVVEGFAELKRLFNETKRDLGDKIDKLDQGFTDVEERTEELERRSLNGSSVPTSQTQ